MSLIWSLKKLIDPVIANQEEEERTQHVDAKDQGVPGLHPKTKCRICGLISDEGAEFCPDCLAGTMEPVEE